MYDKTSAKYIMRKLIPILAILFFPVFLKAGDDLIKIRQLYYKASTNKTDAETFYNTLQATSVIDKVLIEGYKGMAFMIKANFAFNPYYKLNYFIKGKGLLDNAIDSDPKNIELRFLRFCVQTNAPIFLGYSGKIVDDKKEIRSGYTSLEDKDLKARIKEFMQSSKYCAKEEKAFFK